VLGGSSATNGLVTAYASHANLDAWAALGNPGFSWDEMAPYFRKFTTFHPPSSRLKVLHNVGKLDENLNTTSGPIHTAFYPWTGSVPKVWAETWNNMGFALETDPRSGSALGGGSIPSFFDPNTGTRSYSATGFYAPNARRPNLSVLVEAYATKINLETSGSAVRATGICFTTQGKQYTVVARREVILCAGAVKSSQLLELSGIGSPALLESHGIHVMLPNEGVGENLRDHPMSLLSFELAEGRTSIDILRDPALLEEARREYRQHATGPLASSTSANAFMVLSDILSDDGLSALAKLEVDIEAMNVPASIKKQDRILTKFLRSEPSAQYQPSNGQVSQIRTDGDNIFWKPDVPGNHVLITVVQTHPFSRGSIHIMSVDPTVDPAIDPRYLSHPADRFIMAKNLQYLQKVARTEPLASQFKPDGIQMVPCAANMSDEEALEYISLTCGTIFHPIGTCAMLPREDGGVVDPRLRVYGTENLRVVDASIFPIHLQNNICSTVYAVAEKAADMIKEDWA
jgi:choline dehydrogenase